MESLTKKLLCGIGIGAAVAAFVPLCICVDDIAKEVLAESLMIKLKITQNQENKAKHTLTISFPGMLSKANRAEAKKLRIETFEYANINPEEMIGADGEDFLSVDETPVE